MICLFFWFWFYIPKHQSFLAMSLKFKTKNLYTVSKYYIQHIVLQTNYKNRFSIFKYIFTVLNIYHTDHSNGVGN